MHRSSEIKIGVLALQGDFQAHRDKLSSLGVSSIEVRKAEQLSNISGLILPGGESPAMLKLMDAKFRRSIRDIASDGLAVLATCAGIILLAKNVFSPRQESLNVLDIDVTRNAYGRQKDSFIEERLEWTREGFEVIEQNCSEETLQLSRLKAVFIRAPKITRTATSVTTLAQRQGEPMLIRSGNILGATFHPELDDNSVVIFKLFLALVDKRESLCESFQVVNT